MNRKQNMVVEVQLLKPVSPKIGPAIPAGDYRAEALDNGRYLLHVGSVSNVSPDTVKVMLSKRDSAVMLVKRFVVMWEGRDDNGAVTVKALSVSSALKVVAKHKGWRLFEHVSLEEDGIENADIFVEPEADGSFIDLKDISDPGGSHGVYLCGAEEAEIIE